LINVINYVDGPFWEVIHISFLVDLSTVIAIATTLLYFLYDFRFKAVDFKNIFVKKLQIRRNEFVIVLSSLLAILILLSIYFNFTRYWYLYGILLLILSLKYGFGISVLFNFFLYVVVYILPSIHVIDLEFLKTDTIYFVEIFYGISFLSIFSLIIGRSVSDKMELLAIEKTLVENLQNANRSFEEAKTYFTRVFESSPNLIGIIRSIDGTVIDINEEGLKMLNLGLGHGEEYTMSVLDFISSDAWEQIRNSQDRSTQQFEFEIRRQGKPAVLCEIVAREFTIDDEVHLLITATDISEKRAAERQIERANLEKIELNKKIAEFRMMALRSAMSPHFIFNCLNSIQFFILKNNKKEAVHYLTIFSKLVRNVLNISTKSMVTLEVELDIVRYYVALEQMRFDNKFEAVFNIDETVDLEDTEVPPLLIQPYVENAILHGLSHKQGKGLLQIGIRDEGEYLRCVIEDNGVGRDYTRIMKDKKPQVLKHGSKAMSMTQERLELLNSNDIEGVKITDLKDGQNKPIGTRVEILISVD
jgi:PAS domain S-box-containing protein